MTQEERVVYERMQRTHRTKLAPSQVLHAMYAREGNFTVCVLETPNGMRVGVAKCNPRCDEYDEGRGQRISFARALR